MGSLESAGAPSKRSNPLLPASPATAARSSSLRRPRSHFARFLLSKKVGYLQWVFTVAAFLLVVALFQLFLPGSSDERRASGTSADGGDLAEIRDLDFGDGIRFVPAKLLDKWEKESSVENSSALALQRPLRRFGIRKPRLAMVTPDLFPDAMQLHMVSIAAILKEIGYDIEVFTFEDGPVHSVWQTMQLPVNILPITNVTTKQEIAVDWLHYNGILLNSLESRPLISCLLQEPFKSIPVIWTIHEISLALRLDSYAADGQVQLLNDWKQLFTRATVVVFPTHLMPIMYTALDTGNFLVIPGSPTEVWEADNIALRRSHHMRENMSYSPEDFLIAIVSSQFTYSGMLLEHAMILEALLPLLQQFSHMNASLKIGILSNNLTTAHINALDAISEKVGFPIGLVHRIVVNGGMDNFIDIADVVIYGSFLEEQYFPNILSQAMSLGKLVIAPDLGMIRKYVSHGVNAYLFPKGEIRMLTKILLEIVPNGKLSVAAQKVALTGKGNIKNLMAFETTQGYVSLLVKVLMFPSEIVPPKPITEIPARQREEWQWNLFVNISDVNCLNRSFRSSTMLDKLEEQWNGRNFANISVSFDEVFSSIDWQEQKRLEMENAKKRVEEEELKDRSDQPHGTWEEVYRSTKRADRGKNDLHERDDRELERTGQPLCIYEPYFGEGAWPFLHQTSLYRGIGLSTRGRRPGADDIDASSRLPLLGYPYYRDVLGDYGAFFALANRIDRIHKNSWIGFQSWRASARKASLSENAEAALLEAIQTRRHGDALYFWVRMDNDSRNPQQLDFWAFCDAINAGNCRFIVTEILQRMYGVQSDWNSLPGMPNDGDSWSIMQSWVLPTRSFLEFVMFSRMFVDSMDAVMYDEHHKSGYCVLSTSKDRQCYSRVLELLVNVWAYHSARRMVYVNPETGAMQEQHRLRNRRGQMWIRWFSYTTLKSMDEDLAEEADSDHPNRRWLWPSTGEIFWQGIHERERNIRLQQKEKKKQHSKSKILRMKKRAHQKTLGKYIKPTNETGNLNTTETH